MHRPARRLALAALLLALGCAAPAPAHRPAPDRGPADKAALFGDPSLVPTREGERVRREVALAQELEQAIAVLPSVTRARVTVERPERAAEARVLAVVTSATLADAERLPSRIRAMAHAVVGPAAAVEVVVEAARTPTPAPAGAPLRWGLLFCVLGLGFFGGVLIERIRLVRRGAPLRSVTAARGGSARRRLRP